MARKYVVIDAQFHHTPLATFKKAEKKVFKTVEGKGLQARLRDPATRKRYRKIYSAETAIDHMEECGVDMALVGQVTSMVGDLELCKTTNNGMAELVGKYPGKFIPLAHVPCLDGQPAIDELERAVNELGLKGVTVMTSEQGIRLDDKLLRPFFKKVSQLRVPVYVHPTVATLWGGEKYYMFGSVSRQYEIIKTFVEVLSGVLPEFPNLKFLFAHYGGGVPFLLGRIMSWHAPENEGIPKEKIGHPKTIREFEDYGLKKKFNKLLDRVYFDMAGTGGWMPAVKQALIGIKPSRLCFGSDYPWEMSRPSDLKAYITGIKRLDIPEKDKANILGGNLMRLFKV